MSKKVSINEKDREKIEMEIAHSQGRIIQTLVPTILALGLLGIASPENIRDITLGSAFAVLFSSSLYVTSLSYKIFRNAQFLKVFLSPEKRENEIYWENALSEYQNKHGLPILIHSETTTVGAIYMVLSITFFFIFYRVNMIASFVCTFILLWISFCIFLIYKRRDNVLHTWQDLKPIIEEKAQQKDEF